MRIILFIASSIFLYYSSDNIYTSVKSESPSEIGNIQNNEYSETQGDEEYIGIEGETTYDIESFEYAENELVEAEENEVVINENDGEYISDDNPVTWDEDSENYPLETPETYINVDEEEVQSPTQYEFVPEGACAICRDGTYSFSKNRRGTCSHHGGVSKWLSKAIK